MHTSSAKPASSGLSVTRPLPGVTAALLWCGASTHTAPARTTPARPGARFQQRS